MDQRKHLIQFAERELGTKESPAGSNIVKYNDFYYDENAKDCPVPNYKGAVNLYYAQKKKGKAKSFAWCGAFVAYLYHFSDIYLDPEIYYRMYYVPMLQNYLEKIGVRTDRPKPGDLILFDWNKDKSEDHIGIYVDTVLENGEIYYITIEGNTSPDEKGSQSNGGMVCRKKRHASLVAGLYNVID